MNTNELKDQVAVVTGASRGAGRGIAIELGAAGATVYVTGRSTREAPAQTYGAFLQQVGLDRVPGSIDETAEEVTRAGGRGVAVYCDHHDDAQVRALFARVMRDEERLDVLVNNAWGAHEHFSEAAFEAPFWELALGQWDGMFERGVRNHVVSSRHAAPIFVAQKRGLIVTTTFWDRDRYLRGNLFYDLAKSAMNRLAFGIAEELAPHGVASIALSPGFMRTELVLAHMRTDEAHYREHPALKQTESPRYLGRAIVALANAAPADRMSKSGKVLRVAELAREYGFRDVDGSQPAVFELPK
jgi:NAD(P)-dependent dehydrogenase (short-subunit alcohol dehydrogenase family)